MFDGAVVKSNGPANRDIRHFIRNPNTGLLEDRSQDVRSITMSQSVRDRLAHIVEFVRIRELDGRAVTHGGVNSGIFHAIRESEAIEPCVVYLQSAGAETTIKKAVTEALAMGMIRKYALSTGGDERWLGVMDGSLARGEYERQTGRDNI